MPSYSVVLYIQCGGFLKFLDYGSTQSRGVTLTLRSIGVSGFRPSSGILKSTTFRKMDVFPSSGEGLGGTYLLCFVR